jgi:hypothetical protein
MWKPSSPRRRAVLLLCAAAWLPCAFAGPPDMSPDARIDRVENGLRWPIAVRGEAVRTMTLAERMRALHRALRCERRRAGGDADLRGWQAAAGQAHRMRT